MTPALMGKAEKMSVLAVFIGLVVWIWLWGEWGTILAVPMLVVIKAVCDHVGGLEALRKTDGSVSDVESRLQASSPLCHWHQSDPGSAGAFEIVSHGRRERSQFRGNCGALREFLTAALDRCRLD